MEQIINMKLNYYVAPHWSLGLITSNLISLKRGDCLHTEIQAKSPCPDRGHNCWLQYAASLSDVCLLIESFIS